MNSRTFLPELSALLLAASVLSSPTSAQDAGTQGTRGASSPTPPAANAPRAPAGASNAPRNGAPPAAPVRSTTSLNEESDAAARDMQAELEPTPGGLTADEVIRLAFENSPNLKKSELEYDRAAANEARAKLAFAPRIDLAAGYTRISAINLAPFSFGGSPPIENPFKPILDQWSTSARASLPITDIFLTVIPQYKAASKAAKVADYQREAQKLQISYDARVGFYEYARLRGSASVARASVRVREAGVRDLESLVQAGTATQTELVRAQAELANARVLETQALGGVEVARARLEQLTGADLDPERGIGEPFIDIDIGTTPNVDQVLTEAKQARPELTALRTLEEVRKHLLTSRRGATLPKISANAGVLRANPNQRFVPPTDEWKTTWDVGVTVGWSPNDFALAYVQAKDAQTDLKQVHEDLRLLEQGIAIEAASAVTGHRTASEDIRAKTQTVDAARRYEADQRALLLAGAATPNDVLLAQRDLLAASLDWVNSFIAGRIAQAALLKTQGKTGLANGSAGPSQ